MKKAVYLLGITMMLSTLSSLGQETQKYITKTKITIDGKKKSGGEGVSTKTTYPGSHQLEQTTVVLPGDTLHLTLIYQQSKHDSSQHQYRMSMHCPELGGLNMFTGRFQDGPIVYEGTNFHEAFWNDQPVKIKVFDMGFAYENGKAIKGGQGRSIDISYDGGKTWEDFVYITFTPIE